MRAEKAAGGAGLSQERGVRRRPHPGVHTGLPAKTPRWEPVDVFKHKKKVAGGVGVMGVLLARRKEEESEEIEEIEAEETKTRSPFL